MKSKNSQAMKIQYSKLIPGVLIVIFLIILVVQLIPKVKDMMKEEETIYLYFDYTTMDIPLQHKCMHMAVITKYADNINITQFDVLNITYSYDKNFSLLPSCPVKNATYFYFVEQPLLDYNKTIGKICIEYYVDYASNDTLWIEYDQIGNDYKVAESEEVLNKLFKQCEVDKYGTI